jgi:YcxB-like protein
VGSLDLVDWVQAMRVQFDASLDDLVDVTLRGLSRSRSFSPYRSADNLGGGIFGGLFAGVGVYWVAHDKPQEIRLAIAGIASVAALILFPILRLWLIRRRIRRYCREKLGSDLPFAVQVELSPKGIDTKQKTGQVIYEWKQVESIRETPDSIDIYARHGGIVMVKKRAFSSTEEMQRFVEEAKSYLALAQEPGKPS